LNWQLLPSKIPRRWSTQRYSFKIIAILAFVLTVGSIERFQRSPELVSYLGLNPSEDSSGERRRLGGISKQGSSFMRLLLIQGAQTAVRGELRQMQVFPDVINVATS
jgi:transposase